MMKEGQQNEAYNLLETKLILGSTTGHSMNLDFIELKELLNDRNPVYSELFSLVSQTSNQGNKMDFVC